MNQDFVFSSETPVGNLPNLFIVADGMGGHNGGGFASSYAVDVIKRDIEASREKSIEDLLKSAVRAANSAVREKAAGNSDLVGMGTTVVMAVVEQDVLHVCNVGDSRLYVANADGIKQITVDHSYVEEMIRVGQLDRESARTHEHKNIITRAVGADDSIESDYFKVKLKLGDIILMCSDGLSNMLSDDEILMVLKSGRDTVMRAEALINAANENGGADNIAVIVVEPEI